MGTAAHKKKENAHACASWTLPEPTRGLRVSYAGDPHRHRPRGDWEWGFPTDRWVTSLDWLLMILAVFSQGRSRAILVLV